MIDVVYALGGGSRWNDNELRYSLRSIVANFRDLGRVYVVGQKPDWLAGVVHLPADDPLPRNKDGNIIRKVLLACQTPSLSDDFVRLSDDQLLLRPLAFAEMRPYFLAQPSAEKCRGHSSNHWQQRLRRTCELLAGRNLTTFNYDAHIPLPINKHKFIEVMEGCDFENDVGYTINTLYFNSVGLAAHFPLLRRKAVFENPCGDARVIRRRMAGKDYLGYNDRGLTDELKSVLEELFPNPAPFEADALKG